MKTDVIVIGGGHAGIEAAHAAAQLGVSVILITSHVDLIGQMSCNPAIGGIAKGNIVREVDALGGLMGKIADRAGIHFKMLNKSKGFAVWGNRAQADKKQYRHWCRTFLEMNKNIHIYQEMVVEIMADGGMVSGVITQSGAKIFAKAVILSAGTFLNGLGHIGHNSFPCGRTGEPPSLKLSESIQKNGILSGRLKTGTPARIDGKSVDFSMLEVQDGDEDPWPFSFFTKHPLQNKIKCWSLRTTPLTHSIIKDNINKSALYGGKITGIGPRYCPSIEDKIVRFGDRGGHTLFLEPEGLDTNEMYLNGFSTSLPFDIQEEMVKSLPGLSLARIIRPAYAIEYDYFNPQQLYPTLESKIVPRLFFCGQVNGTSGYEEAAGQGIVAGINAALNILGKQPLVLDRGSSYIGVLIDDLVTKGTEEPYRMFTSRAEYRLHLRQDNADERLMPKAFGLGMIDKQSYDVSQIKWEKKAKLKQAFSEIKIEVHQWQKEGLSSPLNSSAKASELLKRPDVSIKNILNMSGIENEDADILLGTEADIKYEGFVNKQKKEIEKSRSMEETVFPVNFDYNTIAGLLTESRQKLIKHRPYSLGHAARIPGVTPADISILIHYLSHPAKQDANI
jgi:tRNA uridine 5-carboxymethylaminomethyl modification enzyme